MLNRMKTILISIIALALASPAGCEATRFTDVASIEQPRHVAAPPGDNARAFVVDGRGLVYVIEHGELLDRPFLDISNDVRNDYENSLYGLLSIAFAPNHEQSRRFYVFYSDLRGDTRVVEFRTSRHNPNVANPDSRRNVLTINQPDLPNNGATGEPHLGGQIAFGPDGLLYIGTGDGTRGYDDEQIVTNAQKPGLLLGKLLRIDPVAKHGPYRIPRDNPFVGRRGRDEIYASGLRNPWRFSFDRGLIAIADAGEDEREEIDILPVEDASGANFGWPMFEGSLRQRGHHERRDFTFPTFEYKHRDGPMEGCRGAVVGGHFARDRRVPRLYGRYVYGDFCFGEIRSFRLRDPYGTDRLEMASYDKRGLAPSSFGLDARAALYATFSAFRDGANVLRASASESMRDASTGTRDGSGGP